MDGDLEQMALETAARQREIGINAKLADLSRRLDRAEQFQRTLSGRDGIRVTGGVITLDKSVGQDTDSSTLDIFVMINGGIVEANFTAKQKE